MMSGLLLILLVIYMCRCPLGMAADEKNHFLRTYEIANVSLLSQHMGETGEGGNYLPGNLLVYIYGNMDGELNRENLEEYLFGNTSLYSPISYLPQAIGVKIVGLFTDVSSAIFYGGKFGNAIVCFLLCVLTLRVAPFGKRIFCLLMTFPITLQEMVSIAPDGFTIALCLFFTAYILGISYGDKPVQRKDIAILAVAGSSIALCKIVYVVLMLLLFMIPGEKFSSRKKSYYFKFGVTGLALLLNLIWLKISSGYLVEFQPGVNSFAQVKFILQHIFGYYSIVVRTLLDQFDTYLRIMVDSQMGALNVNISPIMWLMAIGLLIYETCSCYENGKEVHKWDCFILIMTFLGGAALIFTSLYVQWTAWMAPQVAGVQGRYFTPILATFLMFIIFMRQNKLKEMGVVIGKK